MVSELVRFQKSLLTIALAFNNEYKSVVLSDTNTVGKTRGSRKVSKLEKMEGR